MNQPTIVRDQAMPSRITINNVRVAFVRVNRPEASANNPSSEPKYSLTVLIPNEASDVLQAINETQWAVCSKEFGQQAQNVWQQLGAQDRMALHNGVTKAGQAGFEGAHFLSASAKAERPPKLYHKYLDPQTGGVQVLTPPQNVIYSGCYANVQVNLWAQNNEHGKRINTELLAVQFANDGDPFAAGAAADSSVFSGVQAPAAPGFGAPAAPQPGQFAAPQGAPAAPQPGQFAAPQPGQFAAPQGAPAAPQPGQFSAPGFPGAPQPGQFSAPGFPGAPQGMTPPGI